MVFSIREDGRIEWKCKHGYGHTVAIPYHLVQLVAKQKGPRLRVREMNAHFSHGCDGCCGEGTKNGI